MKNHSCQTKQKRFSWKYLKYLLLLLVLCIAPATTFAYSGTTHPGKSSSGSNVYTVDYLYDSAHNCIYTHFHSTRGGVGAFDWGNQKDFGPYRTSGNLPFETGKLHVGKGHSLKDAVAAGAANGWDWNNPKLQNFLRNYTQNRFGAYYVNGTTYAYLTGITTEEGGAVHPLPPVPATCTTGGYTPYSDGTQRNKTNALGHQPSRWMDRSDGAYHYRICTRPTNQGGCNHKSENNPLQTGQHEYGPWVSDNAYTHHRNCKDCGHKETDNHHFTEWKDDPNKPGWQERHCKDCGHKEWRDVEPPTVSISAAPIGAWQRGDVTVTVKAKDRGSGLKLVSLYRKDVLTGEVACIKNYNFTGETTEQTKTYTETAEGRWLYYAKAADQWSNTKTTDWTGKEAMLDHSNPVQIVTLGGNSTRTVTKHGTKKVYVPGEQKTVTETKQVPKVPVYEDSTTAMQGKNVKVYYNNITYQLDGGSSKDPLPSEYICGKGVKVPNVTKSGYAFMGWTVTCEGKTYSNSPMKDLTIGTKSTGDITLKANWSGTYDIFFTSIPETTQGSMQKTGMMKFGQTYTLPKNQFSLTGYSFAGWNTDFDGNGDHYADQAKVKDLCKTAGGNVILYAEWTPHTYNVAFSPNGGTGSTAGQTFTYDEKKALTANGFSRKGYTFTGWNTKADGSGTAYSDKQSVENLTATDKATVTLYAQWKVNTYTVKIHLNGGKITSNPQWWTDIGNDTYQTTYTVESNTWDLPTLAKDYYDWNGWTGTDKGNTVTISKGSTGNREYWANFNPHAYTITYNLNDGTISGQPTKHTYGTENKIPRPTRDGYTFAGWTVNGGSDRYADVTISANYHENVSLSASWKKVETRDDRIFEWDTNYGHVKATIGEIVRADGTFYSVDTTEDPGAIENHRTATWNQYPRTYVVYVSLPSQLSNGRYRVFLPTWGDSGYTPAGWEQGQDDLIWYGRDDADSLIGFVPTVKNGSPWDSAYNSHYRASSTSGWERNGVHFDYAQFIDGYSDTTHSAATGITQNFRWDWVYDPDGYYDSHSSSMSNWYMHTDLYVYDTQTKDLLLGNGHVFNSYVHSPKCFGEMKYQLRGHVFYNNNDGSGAKTDRILDLNMDIIRADIPEQIRSNPTRNGYTFIGWGTSATTDTIYSRWNWRPQRDLNLYAQWMQTSITL